MRRVMLAAMVAIACLGTALALPTGREPDTALTRARALPVEIPVEKIGQCGAECVIALEGTNLAIRPITVVMRIDDTRSTDYASRFNDEFEIAPGPFRIERSLSDLKASNGRPIERERVRLAKLFQAGGEPGIVLRALDIGAAAKVEAVPQGNAGPAPSGDVRLAAGNLPVDLPGSALGSCGTSCEIVIEGNVSGEAPVTLGLRFDDVRSKDYASRVNEERIVPPGPFIWRKSLKGLQTVDKRDVDPRKLTRMILFNAGGTGRVTIASLVLRPVPPLPGNALGLSFGAADAPLPAGFERVSIGDSRISGPLYAIRRPSPDPLVASGLRGVARLAIAWPPGRARVSLWTEEPGEWENLPHPLDRRIVINGVEVLKQAFTPPQWVKTRYLAGSEREPAAGSDPWTEFGERRGGLVSAEIEVGERGILIEQSGDSPQAMFLSGVLVEAAGQQAALDRVNAERAAWYREHFPVGAPRLHHSAHEANLALGEDRPAPLRLALAPDTGTHAIITVSTKDIVRQPQLRLEPPKKGDAALRAELFVAQRQLEREFANSNLLVVRDDRLRAETARFPIRPGEPRRYEIWVEAPEAAEPGIYAGALAIDVGAKTTTLPIEIEVLPVKLPKPVKAVGYFQEEAPHLSWFHWPGDLRRRQIGCDLSVLAGYGLTGNAPAFSPLSAGSNEETVRDARVAVENGTSLPLMAYAPARRALAEQGNAVGAQSIGDAQRTFIDKGIAPPIWSIADEPSNPDLAEGNLPGLIERLHRDVPSIKLSAYLNSRIDKALMPKLDYAIVNSGYGIDAADLAAVAAAGVRPWIYNSEPPRFVAGLWLWHTKAERFLLWHARAPTADPFDPTDGREGDVQMFYPSMQVCPSQPDVNSQLFDMAEGVVDQRWLYWLDGRPEPEAKALAASIHAELGAAFSIAHQYDDTRLAALRERIIALSRSLH